MSSPIYSNGRYGTNGNGRLGAHFLSWDDVHEGTEEYAADGRKRPGWLSKTDSHDHVCRPVILRADGSMIPAVLPCPPGNEKDNGVRGACATQFMDTNHQYGLPSKGEPLKDYIAGNNRYQEEMPNVKEFFGHIHDAASNGRMADFQPNGYPINNGFSTSVRSSPTDGRNEYAKAGVQELTTLVTDGSWARPSRTGWASPLGYEGQVSTATNSIDKALKLIESARPTATVIDGGWAGPSHTGWATSPGYEGQISSRQYRWRTR